MRSPIMVPSDGAAKVRLGTRTTKPDNESVRPCDNFEYREVMKVL